MNDGTSGTAGGSTTSTPTSTPSDPSSTGSAAVISSPAAGSTLPSATATFSWNAASGALAYFFYAGASQGANNITGRSTGTATSTTVSNLPTNESTLYVRLWTRFSTGWHYRDSTFNATTSANATPTATNAAKAAITSPAPGSPLSGATATFSWSAGTGALEYFFYAGTTQGSNNIIGRSTGTGRAITITNLPRGGGTVYVRLWTRLATGWQHTDCLFRAAP